MSPNAHSIAAVHAPHMLPFSCNFCGSTESWLMADLGVQPLANNYLRSSQDIARESSYPLTARVCAQCRLCQVDRIVSPTEIFSHYAYFSSFSSSWVEHARRYVEAMTKRFAIGSQSLVIEVASNDGYLLRHFVASGVPVLGIEPASNIAAYANAEGIRTVNRFLTVETAQDLVSQGMQADLIAANNVLAHVPDLNDFIGGLARLLKPSGVLTVEFHHLMQLLAHGQFDTIYHEHFSYLSLEVVERMFAAHGLNVFDVEELTTHGGSLRVYARRADGQSREVSANVARVRAAERAAGLAEEVTYAAFDQKVRAVRESVRTFLAHAKAEKKNVVAYGAAAKGNTLLNYCGLTTADMAYTVDKNPHKQGQLLPGSHIPIVAAEKLGETKPAYVLILPWNIAPEITAEHAYISAWGGRFVVALPKTRIVS